MLSWRGGSWDQTQIFFARFVRMGLLKSFDPAEGKFRSWLTTCAQNQARSAIKALSREKRGGGVIFETYDPEQAEREWQAEQTAHLNPDQEFDLQLARNLWRGLKRTLIQSKGDAGGKAALTQALLPLVLLEKWPKQPFPTQEEMAASFGTTTIRLRAYFNHTLKKKARRVFEEEVVRYSPGISTEDVEYLWGLLAQYGEAPH
ncbi:MAG TPA: hypothetical protein DIT64_22725 [Verrucomicrobiales bacterium]|nr:hypothetical protein [Verrucomicrobiales bacterium]